MNELLCRPCLPWRPVDLTAQFQPGDRGVTKWRARTYGTYTLYAWDTGDRSEATFPPQATLLRGEGPSLPGIDHGATLDPGDPTER